MKKIGFFIVVAFLALACEKEIIITEERSDMESPSIQMETKTDVLPSSDVPSLAIPTVNPEEIKAEAVSQ